MLDKIRVIKIGDIIGIFIFLILVIPSVIYKIILKIKNKKVWLISEGKKMARDNGYVFYCFMKEKHPEIKSYYAIDKKSSDYNKIKQFGNIVQWGSIKHYFLYMTSTFNISSHKEGNPNHPLFSFLHRICNLYNNRVFLQHGVLYEDMDMFHWKNTKFKIFICGAKREYDFVEANYEYPPNHVKFTGLARFDTLNKRKSEGKYIAFIPTWRRWIKDNDMFIESEYFKQLSNLINDKRIDKILEKKNLKLLFYPHFSSQPYIDNFTTTNKNVIICDWNNYDVQTIIRGAEMLVTDYSSVFTDFAFQEKPILYFQFDRKEFYENHYGHYPYIDFNKEGFGKIVKSEDEVINELEKLFNNNFVIEDKYLKNIDSFFGLRDNNNCERIFKVINEIR